MRFIRIVAVWAASWNGGAGNWYGVAGCVALWLILELAVLDQKVYERRRKRLWRDMRRSAPPAPQGRPW